MRRFTFLLAAASLLLGTLSLSGCIIVPSHGHGYYGGGYHGGYHHRHDHDHWH